MLYWKHSQCEIATLKHDASPAFKHPTNSSSTASNITKCHNSQLDDLPTTNLDD